MGIYVEWDNEDRTVLRYTYEDFWSWDEFYSASAQARSMLETARHEVNTIVDMRSSTVMPRGMLAQARRALDQACHSNQGLIIGVGVNRFLETMYEFARQAHPDILEQINIVLAPTMEDAYQILDQQRAEREPVR